VPGRSLPSAAAPQQRRRRAGFVRVRHVRHVRHVCHVRHVRHVCHVRHVPAVHRIHGGFARPSRHVLCVVCAVRVVGAADGHQRKHAQEHGRVAGHPQRPARDAQQFHGHHDDGHRQQHGAGYSGIVMQAAVAAPSA